jgi:hypothetical protein
VDYMQNPTRNIWVKLKVVGRKAFFFQNKLQFKGSFSRKKVVEIIALNHRFGPNYVIKLTLFYFPKSHSKSYDSQCITSLPDLHKFTALW